MDIKDESAEIFESNEISALIDENSKSQAAAADLAARREARRRKILENSNNRLSKLTGREHNEPPLFEGMKLNKGFNFSNHFISYVVLF